MWKVAEDSIRCQVEVQQAVMSPGDKRDLGNFYFLPSTLKNNRRWWRKVWLKYLRVKLSMPGMWEEPADLVKAAEKSYKLLLSV